MFCLIGHLQVQAQQMIDTGDLGLFHKDLLTSRHTSYQTFIYQLSDEEARRIYHQRKWSVDPSFFHTLMDTYPTDSTYDKVLDPGHYLRVFVKEDKLQLDITSVQKFGVETLNNSTDLQIRVFTVSGELISDAEVKVRHRNIRFDPQTQTYRIHKANKKGLLEVTYNGETFFYSLDRQIWNPLAKRIAGKVLYETPLKYPWVPVRFVLFIPIDGVKSIINGYPRGSIYRIKEFFVKLYRSAACLLDESNCYYRNTYRFTSKHQGYLEFSKPKYAPGDTVKLKAFITKKGKPLKKPVDLVLMKTYSEGVKIATLHPYRKGAYEFSFPISDTLNLTLDKSYQIKLQKKEDKTYFNGYFKYEDYELEGNNLALRTEERNHYQGDTLVVFASGTDENDLKLLDARLEVLVRPTNIHEYHDPIVFIPDTLAYFELPLEPTGETAIKIPANSFPKANLIYTVDVALLTSDNERIEERKEVDYYYHKQGFVYDLIRDSITFKYMVNGKAQSKDVTISIMDGYGNKFETQSVTLPYTTRVNPYSYTYEVKGEDQWEWFSINNESSELNFMTDRDLDSITIRTNNPRNIPFSYNLYKTNHELKRGYSTDLRMKIKAHNNQNYYLAVQYIWGGQVYENNYEIPLRKDLLNVKLEAPPIIYPGQEVELEMMVTDILDQPVANVDLLAFGLTKKFDFQPDPLPRLAKRAESRDLINTFSVHQRPFFQKERRYDIDLWRPLAALDTIEYFKFIYPGDQLYRYEYYPEDSITQFSPFVVKNGLIQPVSIVYVDNVPVYFEWSFNEPYSFRINSGLHTIRIRTRLAEYEVGPIEFPPNKRVIFSFDQDQLPPIVKKSESKFTYSDLEKRNLYRYILAYRNDFGERHGYFQQGNRYFSVNPPSNRTIFAGPVFSDSIHFQLLSDFNLTFDFDPYYEYGLRPGTIKQKAIDAEKQFPKYANYNVERSISDLVWTPSRIEEKWNEVIKQRRIQSRRYYNPYTTTAGKGRLQLEQNTGQSHQPLNSLFFKLDDADFFRVYPGLSQTIHNLEQGWYKAIFFFDKSEYAIIDSIGIKTNGLNHFNVDSLDLLPADTFSIKIDQLMNEFFNKQNGRHLLEGEKDQLYRTYQQQFQYFGEGEYVSGYIYSSDGEPLPGVSIIVKGTTYGTISDINGFYSLKVPYNHSGLQYSFVGFTTEERMVGDPLGNNVYMTEDVQALEEVVVVGYGETYKKDITASVATVSPDLLMGKVPGIVVTGQPGDVRVRGAASISSEGSPLIIIDGVPYFGDINDLDPKYIDKADLLKGANAEAIYGARAANGVLIITTSGGMPGIKLPGENEKGALLTDEFMSAASEANTIRNNFSDEAFWRPRLRTDANGQASIKVKFPDDITKWETFVYSINDKKQIGQTTGEIKSFKPISAQLQIPRFLVEGDSALVLGKALNYTFDTVNVKTSFLVNENLKQSNEASFLNSWIDSLLLIPDYEDSIQVTYSLERQDGYFDGEQWELPVYRKGVEVKEGYQATLTGDTTINWTFTPEKGPVKIYANTDPIKVISDKIEFLQRYPYGCNEQLASKLKAMLVAKQVEDQLEIKRVSLQIKRLINLLENHQNNDGLWGWWNNNPTDLWISVHVVEALKMAVDAGYTVSIDLKRIAEEAGWNLLSNLHTTLKTRWLYIAAVLSLNIDKEALIKQFDTLDLSLEEELRLVQIKQLIGKAINTKWVIDSLQSDLFGGLYLKGGDQLSYANKSLNNTATALSILAKDTTVNESIIKRMENYLLTQLSDSYYPNTYVTSNIIVALSSLMDAETPKDSELIISGDLSETVTSFPYKKELSDIQSVSVSSNGRLPVFINAYQTIWNDVPSMDSSRFVVASRFANNTNQLKAGKPERLIVKVQSSKEADYVMIEIPIPAGCSYNTKRNYYRTEAHREYFRNKVSIFCKQLPAGTYEFEVDLLPRYTGTYSLNPAKVELMYFPVIKSHEGLKRVMVE